MTRGTKVTLIFLALVLLGALITAWYVLQRSAEPSAREQALLGSDREIASSFTDAAGEPVDLATTLEGDRPVVVTTWASWCPTCREQLLALQQVAATYQGEITFLAINRNETRAQAGRYLATLPDLPDLTILLDPDDRYYKDVAGYAMPETIVYSSAGEVLQHLHGDSTSAELEQALQTLQ